MKMPKGYCAKIYGRSGMTVKHGIHLAVQGPSARNSVELVSFRYYFFCLYLTFGECCESVP